MNYLFSLHPLHSPSTSLPVSQPRWFLELISPRYQLCLSHPAEQLFEAVSPWQLRKSPAAPEDCTALGFSHPIEVLRHSELGSCQGHPSHLVGSCPIIFFVLLCLRRCGIHTHKACGWFRCGWVPPLPILKLCPSGSTRIWSLNDANLQLDSESIEFCSSLEGLLKKRQLMLIGGGKWACCLCWNLYPCPSFL